MLTFFVIVAAFYGLAIGSFLNAVVYRVPRNESLNTRSHCPRCDAMIKWYQNIPVFSFLALRGKCAVCALPISWRYPAVELTGAVVFASITAYFAPVLDLPNGPKALIIVALLVFAAAAIALALIDWELQLLPTKIIYPVLAFIVVAFSAAAVWAGTYDALIRAFAGMGVLGLFYGLLWFWKPGAMGFGDVRLSLILGFVLGYFSWPAIFLGTFLAFMLASLYGLALMARRGASKKTAVAFGPWMLVGAWVSLTLGPPIIDMYLRLGGLS